MTARYSPSYAGKQASLLPLPAKRWLALGVMALTAGLGMAGCGDSSRSKTVTVQRQPPRAIVVAGSWRALRVLLSGNNLVNDAGTGYLSAGYRDQSRVWRFRPRCPETDCTVVLRFPEFGGGESEIPLHWRGKRLRGTAVHLSEGQCPGGISVRQGYRNTYRVALRVTAEHRRGGRKRAARLVGTYRIDSLPKATRCALPVSSQRWRVRLRPR